MERKHIIIFSITSLVALTTFFWLNYFETRNDCTITAISNIPFVSCIENPPYKPGIFPFPSSRMGPDNTIKKPLILLYPQKDTVVDVRLNYQPWFFATFPAYDTSKKWWSVLAHPDGTLLDYSSQQETYGLFWEGYPSDIAYDTSKGFVVKGSEVREFLYTKLREMGLNTKEYSDFIMYWYPLLQDYPYVQISFVGKDYTDKAKLGISPTPDSLLRVFMVVKPLSEYRIIPPQSFEKFERNGFSVVEWGGTIIN